MNHELLALVEKTAAYIEQTQPVVEKAAAFEANWAAKLVTTADKLVSEGALELSKKAEFIDGCTKNPLLALDFMTGVAAIKSAAPSLGHPVVMPSKTQAAAQDPWERLLG